jgi:hypothetical protein
MTQTPVHDWLLPRLEQLIADGAAAGFEREAVLAVLVDLATSAPIDTAPLPEEPPVHGPWLEPTEGLQIRP